MDLLQATNILLGLLNTGTNMLAQATQVSALIQKAHTEGRTTFTPEEWAVIAAADATSRQVLLDAITKALAK